MEKIGSFKNGVMQWKYKPERAKRVYLISFAQAGIYIGSTIDIYKRFKNFVRGLTRNNYPNWKLQAAFNSSPTFEVYELEKVNPNDRRTIREQFFIDILRPELNICPAGLHYDNKRFARELSELLRKPLKATVE